MQSTGLSKQAQAALAYAQRGWPVFPVFEIKESGDCACGRTHCGSAGKHPRTPHGLKEASTSAEQIRRWWNRWSNANVAIRTGMESGLVVLDVDPRNDGMRSLEELEHVLGGFLPECPTVITGGGGTHTYFTVPDDGKPVPSVGSMLPGIDVKADGGYVMHHPRTTPAVGSTPGTLGSPWKRRSPPCRTRYSGGSARRMSQLPAPNAETPTGDRRGATLRPCGAFRRCGGGSSAIPPGSTTPRLRGSTTRSPALWRRVGSDSTRSSS